MVSYYHLTVSVVMFLALAVAQNTTGTTYNTTISWYGTNDARGSPNCNSNKAACGFYTYPGFSAAVSQNLFGAAAGAGAGPACGTCYKLTVQTDAASGAAVPNAGSSIVVMVNNLCPATDDNPLCAQSDLQSVNQFGATVDFNLCNDDGAHAALLTPAGTGLALGTAVAVSCSDWEGEKKEDCGSDCGGEGGLGGAGRKVSSLWTALMPLIMICNPESRGRLRNTTPAYKYEKGRGRRGAEYGDPNCGTNGTFERNSIHQDSHRIDMDSLSIAYSDQAIACLVKLLKPVDNRDKVGALCRRVFKLEGQRSDARAEIVRLQYLIGDLRAEAVELEQQRCRVVEEILKKTMDAKFVAAEKDFKWMREDRDCWSKMSKNAHGRLQRTEEDRDVLGRDIRKLKEIVGAQQNTLREQENTIRERETLHLTSAHTSARLAGRAKKQDRRNKSKLDNLNQERDLELSQALLLSRQHDGSR
ncbi:hypothetical protein N0V82_009777 [Gnomoniopsis sp. IMI 355080]|nr:hypothetical protein N0V82_009777 [Gnomoniopsis sp. IMI 355080]